MRTIGLGAAVALVMALVMLRPTAPADADPLRLVQVGPLPFGNDELANAVALRAVLCPNLDAGPHDLIVTVTSGTRRVNDIELVVAGRHTTVLVGHARGEEAARLVAIAIIDLAADRIDPPAALVAAAPALGVATAGSTQIAAAVPFVATRAAVRGGPAYRLSPRAYVAIGVAYQERTTPRIEAGVTVGSLMVSAAAGRNTAAFTTSTGQMAAFTNYPIQVGVGHRWQLLAHGGLEAKLVAASVLRVAAAQRRQTDAQFGGGAALMWTQQLAQVTSQMAIAIRIGGGVEAYRTSFDYQILGVPITSTQAVGWFVSAMLSVEVER